MGYEETLKKLQRLTTLHHKAVAAAASSDFNLAIQHYEAKIRLIQELNKEMHPYDPNWIKLPHEEATALCGIAGIKQIHGDNRGLFNIIAKRLVCWRTRG